MTATLDILAIGEPLIELAHEERAGETVYLPGYGGDTSNCAIAAARQGARVGYLTAVGDDAFGRELLTLWDREGVDRTAVQVRANAQTGIYFITYEGGQHRFTYRRAGSAASLLRPGDVPEHLVAEAHILHASGISQAVSASACDAVFHAMRLAKGHGRLVSYDTNLRLALWPLDRARAVIHAAAALADILKPSLEDAGSLLGVDDPDTICDRYLATDPRVVTLTMGADGTLIATPEGRRRLPAFRVELVDATGAGDTFAGSFLAEYLRTGDPFQSGRYASASAAIATQGRGAVAPMPRRAEVEAFLSAAA